MRFYVTLSLLLILTASFAENYAEDEEGDSSAILLSDFNRPSYITFGADASTEVVIHWGTTSNENSIVAYGLYPALSETAQVSGTRKDHHVPLNGLTAGTRYAYRVVGKTYHGEFYTAPRNSIPFNFLVYGDMRTNYDPHAAICLRMDTENSMFAINTGDLIENGGSTSDWENFFRAESCYISDHIMMPSKGNHDISWYPWDDDPFGKIFAMPEYGSFDYGNVHVTYLKTELGLFENLDEQAAWVETDLATAAANPNIVWKTIFFHHPPFSAGEHGNNDDVRDAFVAIFKRYNVDVVFSGHDHDYERTLPINYGVYFVSGGGGAPLRDVAIGENTYTSQPVYHYIAVEVKAGEMWIRAKNIDGTTLDETYLHKGPHILKPQVNVPHLALAGTEFRVYFWEKMSFSRIRATITSIDSALTYSVACGSPVNLGSGEYYVTVTLPASMQAGLYHLKIADESGLYDVARNSIAIFDSFPTNYDFIHITDIHYGASSEVFDNLTHAHDVINMLNPPFVIATGDIGDNGYRRELFDFSILIKRTHVPYFIMPGNHDYMPWDKADGFSDIISRNKDIAFRFGHQLYLLFDSGEQGGLFSQPYGLSAEQRDWAEAKLIENSDAYFTVGGTHGPIFDILSPIRNGVVDWVTLARNYNIFVTLTGHTHYNKVYEASGSRVSGENWSSPAFPLFIQTASVAKTNIATPRTDLRIVSVAGHNITRLTADDDKNGYRDAETAWDIWRWNMNMEIAPDRLIGVYYVDNDHVDSFSNCRAYFNMAPGIEYICIGGTILSTLPSGLVTVSFDIASESVETVIVMARYLSADDVATRLPKNFELNAYPNPFNDALHIELSHDAQVEIYSADGRKVAEHFGSSFNWVPTDEMPSGTYYVRAVTENKVFRRSIQLVR